MSGYYEMVHRAGYGSDGHLAPEVIARAARHLGLVGDDEVHRHIGHAASPAEEARTVRLDVGPGIRARMVAALSAARGEFERRPGCCIEVVKRRVRLEQPDDWTTIRVVEERQGRRWVTLSREET
jgi:hypothetical protein